MSEPAPLQTAKAALRASVQAELRTLSPEARAAASAQARERLRRQPVWREARSVLFYSPRADEVDLWPLLGEALAEGKLTALPRYDAARGVYSACRVADPARDLRAGRYGIAEPVAPEGGFLLNRLDLILVPGVGFDLRGRRLGRGKGYYDQLLAALRGLTCGVGFDQQIVSSIPVAPHDVSLNCILTPSRWHPVGQGSAVE